jgi:hypothetical protein
MLVGFDKLTVKLAVVVPAPVPSVTLTGLMLTVGVSSLVIVPLPFPAVGEMMALSAFVSSTWKNSSASLMLSVVMGISIVWVREPPGVNLTVPLLVV